MRGGGSEHQVALLAEHLPRESFEVHLYLTHRVGDLLPRIPDDVVIHSPEAAPVSFLEKVLNRWPGRILRNQARDFDALLRREKIDVVYDRAFHNTLIAGHPSVTTPVRRVSTIVSPPHLALPSVEKRFVQQKRRRLADAYRRSDEVIAVSHAVAESASRYYGLPIERISVIRNPVDLNAIRSSVQLSELPMRSTIDQRRLNLVCVGRMSSEKGQGDLVEAIARLPQPWPEDFPRFRVRFIGDGPLRGELQRRAESLADSKGTVNGHEIEFCGIISPAVGEIAAADALVCPSHFEGMPNVVLEAFALGTPVIATRAGGTAELQSDPSEPTCFWADPGDPNSLSLALLQFVEDSEHGRFQVDSAARWVIGNHSVGPIVGEIIAKLQGTAAKRSRR
ncbi:putative teichuronic acid biosynthesis glycosyltransferase TuaC [Neorhodopirellula pilleata]|uniref:Putative teichuronic acid biosynthesis glycosyltransferase TuaC n=2 Tax=Neorhodopirellula pilleata TaxID=2714738 RepID=A0A5C6AWS7_9BACT|nr:putative teichuronic acid biosynthesis glycosyltransferase TuaC [Neorhodopirellula pilleata]